MECPDCSPGGYRFSKPSLAHFEKHQCQFAGVVSRHPYDADQQEGRLRAPNSPLMGFGSYKPLGYMCLASARLQDKEFQKLLGVVEWTNVHLVARQEQTTRISAAAEAYGPALAPVIGRGRRCPAQGQRSAALLKTSKPQRLGFVHEAVSNKVSLLAD